MTGKQPVKPVAVAVFGQRDKFLLQRHRRHRVVARGAHILDTVVIRRAFGVSPILLPGQLQRHPGATDNVVAVFGVLAGMRHAEQNEVEQRGTLLGARAVLGGRVHDFVSQHGGEFSFVIQRQQQPASNRDFAAGQRPRIGRAVIHHYKLIWQPAVTNRRHPPAHRRHILTQHRIRRIQPATRLLHRPVVLLAHRDFIGSGKEHHIVLPGHRIGGAGGEG